MDLAESQFEQMRFFAKKNTLGYYQQKGETCFICWNTLHWQKFSRSAIGKKIEKKKETFLDSITSVQRNIFKTF
jgi:hypothetical protein